MVTVLCAKWSFPIRPSDRWRMCGKRASLMMREWGLMLLMVDQAALDRGFSSFWQLWINDAQTAHSRIPCTFLKWAIRSFPFSELTPEESDDCETCLETSRKSSKQGGINHHFTPVFTPSEKNIPVRDGRVTPWL